MEPESVPVREPLGVVAVTDPPFCAKVTGKVSVPDSPHPDQSSVTVQAPAMLVVVPPPLELGAKARLRKCAPVSTPNEFAAITYVPGE